ncbi:MAG: hypothetical protein ACI38U_08505 [Corynebacterium sp.]|uniref:hypothetical protein n=1 Tax=unclassified Corynebacterium TaxID=2624378 RepID=UPI0009681536|nr:hypothetical protein [Corynebacterium sp. CNJ-954]OLT53451.1 hypothetical protein BJF89_17565 [Corynebacterium sp. CNJ-954]
MTISLSPELVYNVQQWRHHIHRHPELAFDEKTTARYIAEHISNLPGVEVATGIGDTGVVGTLSKGEGGAVAKWCGLASRYDKFAVVYRAAAVLSEVVAWTSPLRDTALGHDGRSGVRGVFPQWRRCR